MGVFNDHNLTIAHTLIFKSSCQIVFLQLQYDSNFNIFHLKTESVIKDMKTCGVDIRKLYMNTERS